VTVRLVPHPTAHLDEVVHQRARLGILAILAGANEVDFGYLRQTLKLTDGNLSGHLQVLEKAGLIALTKGYEGKRPRTWVRITNPGRDAFQAELATLQQLVQHFEQPGTSRPQGTRPAAHDSDDGHLE
jgi:DNA-binding MarR family transcriptional regulator